MYDFTQLLRYQQGVKQGQFLSKILFSFSLTGCLTKTK